MKDNIKNPVKVATRGIITGIEEETIEDTFTGGMVNGKQIKTLIKSMVDEALIDIFKQGRLDTTLVQCVNNLEKLIRFMNARRRQVV